MAAGASLILSSHYKELKMILKLPAIVLIAFNLIPIESRANSPDGVGLCKNLELTLEYKYKNSEWTIEPNINFLLKDPDLQSNNEVTAVVEIPSGCNDKWEVHPKSGELKLDMVNGTFRFIVAVGPFEFSISIVLLVFWIPWIPVPPAPLLEIVIVFPVEFIVVPPLPSIVTASFKPFRLFTTFPSIIFLAVSEFIEEKL